MKALPHIADLVTAARRAIRRAITTRLEPYGLSAQQFALLMQLAHGGASSLRQLARAQLMDEAGASRVLSSLAARGYVSSTLGLKDRRRLQISLTSEGTRVVARVSSAVAEVHGAQTRGIPGTELSAARRALARLIDNMEHLADPRVAAATAPTPRRARP